MNDAVIEVTGLRKRFGPTLALGGVTFTAPPGKVTGFIGPNGAGKSTTIRVILGLDAPDEGRARVGGRPYQDLRNPLRHVGALIDAAAVQPSRTARNHLLWLARSQALEAGRVDAVLELVGLAAAARRKAGGFSLGMRQRLGIAAAMLGDPPVVILDEPFNGMDPEGIVWMRKLLRTLAAEGRALLVSSHLMSELQGIADHIVVIGRGKVLADAGIDELLARAAGEQVLLQTPTPAEAARVLHRAGAATTILDDSTLSVSGLAARQVVEALGQSGVVFSEVTTQRATLEDVYFQLTSGEAEFRTETGQGAQR
ncbi:ABC transporter ATP-binding protein [Actinoallomurus rhizosphaericola]|uniref:ABC transporter ATP-binding protein n=1 Tax=Actinoallomurus rhizosphaericola TaxID=2952536 RepID=UPI002093BCE8|nr:ATP-binding cassette domain-containing protein [Actinoallomurus rhizosphaericola]MCO5995698.1 ATP-binding cassette domain-containing protein [Actinoallomurus rhizosphaericola]